MKHYVFRILAVFVLITGMIIYTAGISSTAVAQENKTPEAQTDAAMVPDAVGLVENILFARLPGKERIHLVVSKQPFIDVKSKVDGGYLIKLENMVFPDNLNRPLGEGELNNIISVVPSRESLQGKSWVYLNILIHQVVPYSIRQEGQNVLIDFNVAGLQLKKAADPVKAAEPKKVVAKVSAADETAVVKKDEPAAPPLRAAPVRKPTERIISLDFQDADIKSVLRLMAEYGNISIVSSDEVKGATTLSMKNVPWSKALDTILEVNGLTKRQEGNVIIVTSMERSKKEDAAREEVRAREQKMMAEKGLLKQVLIEAKIVEATEEFVRNLGVQWGFGNYQKHDSGTYGLGIAGGTSTSTAKQYTQSYPPQVGIVDTAGRALTMAAVNFPSTIASPAIGLVFGGATGFLETQLAALESNSTGKIISAPKVVTMEGIKAIIKQGEEVPYTTPASGTSPATVSFKEALLKLEVTPKLTPEGKISMDITASNDYPDWSKASQNPSNNPPIIKNEVQSKVVVNDGDTVVIGGIVKSTDSQGVKGLPWLQKVPVLGWLFKTEDVTKTKRQLLIFVTPKILASDYTGESPDSIINR